MLLKLLLMRLASHAQLLLPSPSWFNWVMVCINTTTITVFERKVGLCMLFDEL